MALNPGQKLGPYEIIGPAGAGGMGEVYKATDTRLDRLVAIKILPARTAGNESLRTRFEREARAISSLNHPHICTLYDVGQEDRTDYLVMEYLQGESLADRLLRGPLPADELLRYATEIAEGLDRAHRQGLVHRDLKPANVMITQGGAKLLDFGLAKLQIAGGVVAGASAATHTTPLTGEGAIIGTLQYMAPEQLEGKEADARSDIFAFGAILYEMATGRRAFQGNSQASLIARILERDPDPISSVVPMAPPALDRLVRKCLAKDPNERWQSAWDLLDELRWISQSGSQAGVPIQVASRRRFRFRLAWAVATGATLAAAALLAFVLTRPAGEPAVRRYSIGSDGLYSQAEWGRLSPDGKLLTFLARDTSGSTKIWLRPLNSLDAYPLPGTEGANRPFWSPDSRFLAFFTGRQLKRIPAAGGPAMLVCEVDGGADGCWGSGGVILFDGALGDSIRQVQASGGVATGATSLDRDARQVQHAWPWFLPDGKHFLYVAYTSQIGSASDAAPTLMIGSLDGLTPRKLFEVESRVEYSSPGYLVYTLEGVLLARPFDADRLEIIGDPIPVASNIADASLRSDFSVADDGTLVYRTGGGSSRNRLLWLDRTGKELNPGSDAGPYTDVALSPDNNSIAYARIDERSGFADIWVRDLRRDVSSRLTFGESMDIWPVWTPDGKSIIYSSAETGVPRLNMKPADGTGEARPIATPDSSAVGATDISRDGRLLVTSVFTPPWDIKIIDLQDGSVKREIVSKDFSEWRGKLSPDGRYLAYQSNESGSQEIYIARLDSQGGRWQVSNGGGFSPQWRDDGRELYYVTPAWDFVAIPIITQAGLEFGKPAVLFNRRYTSESPIGPRYAVVRDGQRFLVSVPTEAVDDGRFIIIQNWEYELRHP